jgi:GT2 family glycosyltransferase
VTWNAASDVERCIGSVRRQTHQPLELLVVDNASTDGTSAIVERLTTLDERVFHDRNLGFSAAHNLAIRRTHGEFYLCLNPDVVLSPDFVAALVEALAPDRQLGSASGKLLSAADPRIIDSTGIYMVPSQRHFDRGQGERDAGQYEQPELVFGCSGAAGFYRRDMLEDVTVGRETFDEDFFAYREDADLAWRAQLFGWSCVYVPWATARHARRVTPDRRAALPDSINRLSVRNRFYLRLKNQTPDQAIRFALPGLRRDLQVIGYVLLREHSSIGGLVDVVRRLPRMWRKRRAIMSRYRARSADLRPWFHTPARPYERLPRPIGR